MARTSIRDMPWVHMVYASVPIQHGVWRLRPSTACAEIYCSGREGLHNGPNFIKTTSSIVHLLWIRDQHHIMALQLVSRYSGILGPYRPADHNRPSTYSNKWMLILEHGRRLGVPSYHASQWPTTTASLQQGHHHLFPIACPHASHISHNLAWVWLVLLWLFFFLPSIATLIGLSLSLPKCQVLRRHAVPGLLRSRSVPAPDSTVLLHTLYSLQGPQSSNFICLSGIDLRQARALSI